MTVGHGYSRVVLPVAMLEERRRLGLDRRDEVWDGELHMAPSPTTDHQAVAKRLLFALEPIVRHRKLESLYEINVRDPARGWDDFRVPDLVVYDPRHRTRVAIDGRAEVVIEVLSPNDESRLKFDFYARREVQEVWIVDPDVLEVEVYTLRGDRYERVMPVNGVLRAPSLGIDLLLGDGALRIQDGEEIVEV